MRNITLFFIISSFLFIVSGHLLAQDMQDVVYLKNGSIIHGTIIEQVPGVSIKIKTADGNTYVYKMEEISKTTKEEVTEDEEKQTTDTKVKRTKGFFMSADATIAFPTGNSNDVLDMGFGNNFYLGYILNRNFVLTSNLGWNIWTLDEGWSKYYKINTNGFSF